MFLGSNGEMALVDNVERFRLLVDDLSPSLLCSSPSHRIVATMIQGSRRHLLLVCLVVLLILVLTNGKSSGGKRGVGGGRPSKSKG